MPYLIDSDILIDHLDELPEAVRLVDALISEGGIYLSVISYLEALRRHPARAVSRAATGLAGVR